MANVSITKKPTKKVSNLSLERKGTSHKLNAKWKVSSQVTKTTSASRATFLQLVWTVTRVNSKGKVSKVTKTVKTNNMDTTVASFNPCNFSVTKGTGARAKTTAYTRRSYYPYTGVRLKSVTLTVYTGNAKGVMETGASKTYAYERPGWPSNTDMTQAKETGHICFEIKAYDWKDEPNERVRTDYEILTHVVKPDPQNPGEMSDDSWTDSDSFTGASIKFEDTDEEGKYHIDVPDRFSIGYDGYIGVAVRFRSVGIMGTTNRKATYKTGKNKGKKYNESWSTYRTIYVSYPRKPVISGVSVDKVVTDAVAGTVAIQDTGVVTVSMPKELNEAQTEHPITGMRLQKLVSTDATTMAQAIARGNEWEDTDIVDDGHCTALSISVADVKPTRGTHTWVRVKCWNQFEDMFFRYSDPMELTDLYADPLTSSGSATIRSLVPASDGTSLIARIGWTEVGEIPMTGTEVSWSKNPNAWRSNEKPTTDEFDWSDTKDPVADADFGGVATYYIGGLEQGELYHVRVRRYYDDDEGERTYGAYSDTITAMPVSSPSSVALSAPPYIASGRSVPLTWTYDSEAEQKAWKVYIGSSELVDPEGAEGEVAPTDKIRQWSGVPVENDGSDASGSTVIDWERIEPFIENGEVSFAVSVSTGGDYVTSDIVVTQIAEPPTLSLTVPETVTAQPLGLTVASETTPRVVAVVRAGVTGCSGTGGETPGRGEEQAPGDVVWQVSQVPEWAAATEGYTATLTGPVFPDELELLDNGSYVVTATAIDDSTGLSSPEVTEYFNVAWARQAASPSDETTVTPYDTTDEDGYRERGCVIALAEPTGAGENDVCDVYRLTPDGPYLVAEGVGLSVTVTDRYAPYGGSEIGYRVCVRTTDGDMDWLDFPYVAAGTDLRIDFGSEYVELPWNLSLSDSYAKDFEARRKLDGSMDGYWNDGIERKAGFSSDLIRVREQAKAAAVRRLARHVGPCFVRTPDGCAYMADVEVSDLSGARKDAALAVSIDATEVRLADEFRASLSMEDSGTGEYEGQDDLPDEGDGG